MASETYPVSFLTNASDETPGILGGRIMAMVATSTEQESVDSTSDRSDDSIRIQVEKNRVTISQVRFNVECKFFRLQPAPNIDLNYRIESKSVVGRFIEVSGVVT